MLGFRHALKSFASATSQGCESTLRRMLIAALWLRWTVHTLKSGLTESVCGSGADGNLIAKPSDGYEYSFDRVEAGVLGACCPTIAPTRTPKISNRRLMPRYSTGIASEWDLNCFSQIIVAAEHFAAPCQRAFRPLALDSCARRIECGQITRKRRCVEGLRGLGSACLGELRRVTCTHPSMLRSPLELR